MVRCHTRGFRLNKDAPYEIKTEGQRVRAEAQKRKMILALSTITGVCRTLGDFDIPMISACSSPTEIRLWRERTEQLSAALGNFAAKLSKVGGKNG